MLCQRTLSSLSRAVSGLALPVILGLVAPHAGAQTTPIVYGMNETGNVTVNGTVLDKLKSSFDPDTPNQNTFQKWFKLVVNGADRYALRLDGQLYKNGKSLYKLPFGTTVTPQGLSITYAWVGLTYGASGIYALRQDGMLTLNGTVSVMLPQSAYFFTSCLAVPHPEDMGATSDVYALRSDGTVFKNVLASSGFLKFTGGPGLNVTLGGSSTNAADGAGTETVWQDLALDPVHGTLRGLRVDGKISSGSTVPPTPPAVDPDLLVLPYPTDPSAFIANGQFINGAIDNNRYSNLTFLQDGSGSWIAERGNGQLYSQASVVVPFIDLPDGGSTPIDDTYIDIAVDGANFWTIRWDGNVYANTDTTPILKLVNNRYRSTAISHTAPDLTNFKNPKPLAQYYTATVYEGDAVSLPVVVSDIEKLAADLLVTELTPLKKPLPVDLVFDPVTRLITWPAAGPKGTYKVPIVVDDGVNKPKTFNFTIKVKVPDANPLKNKKPGFVKVKNTVALAGFPYELQVFATDADPGDTINLTADTTKAPFTDPDPDHQAHFVAVADIGTGLFTWTPTFDNLGKTKVKFTATDALGAHVSYTVTINVVNPLIFPDLGG